MCAPANEIMDGFFDEVYKIRLFAGNPYYWHCKKNIDVCYFSGAHTGAPLQDITKCFFNKIFLITFDEVFVFVKENKEPLFGQR